MIIYHITSREAWMDATRDGSYSAPSLLAAGFIHCSTAAQILPVARQFYGGQRGLVLLAIDTRRLSAEVKWERSLPPEGIPEGATFPHIHGEIGLDAVIQSIDFEPNGDGEFNLTELPAETGSAGSS